MSTLSLPLNFGHRPCDRLLVRSLCSSEESRFKILWMAYLVWQDFATAREDRRDVPADPAARATSPAVDILESYIQWDGQRGGFVDHAITAGFFLLVPISEEKAELILADFFPANASSKRISVAEMGGIGKSFARVVVNAEACASDQLQLFKANNVQPVEGASSKEIKAAATLIHSVCLALKLATPKSEEWKGTLMEKAVHLVREHGHAERECVLRWFIKNRSDQRIPARIDLVLNSFPTFIEEARHAFARG